MRKKLNAHTTTGKEKTRPKMEGLWKDQFKLARI